MMSSMHRCSECGADISAARQGGLCTRCLLQLGLKAEAAPRHEPTLKLQIPAHFGDYELLEEVARGGMGIVYRARQVSLDRTVAVKLLLTGALSSPENVKRFRVEASAAASLQHPNIVTMHEVGVHQDQHYLVMDFVAGPSLAKRVAQGPLPPQRAAAYVKTVAEAVHFAHEHGILHRDLKPSNILLDAKDQPRVTDFGLAKRFEGETEITVSGQLVGSPSYLPPEQAADGRGKVSRRSDVYGLGATLYHLLAGRAPFQAASIAETLQQVRNTEPVAPRLLNPAVPRDLETICLKCLEKEPARRYPTAQALADELERFRNGQPVLARPIGPAGKGWRWCRRNPRLASALGVAALSLLVGLVGVGWQWRQAESQRAHAEEQTRRARDAALLARRNAYAADMNAVQQKIEDSDWGSAREILNCYRPEPQSGILPRRGTEPELDLRGWEWRYFWERCRPEERFTLHQYSNAVSALAFSPDGKWLAVRHEAGAVALWDARTRRFQSELPAKAARGFRWCNKALAFSPRGDLLARGNADAGGQPVVSLRDLSEQRDIVHLPLTADLVSVTFSPDAAAMATLDYDGRICVWDMAAQRVVRQFATASVSVAPEWSALAATEMEAAAANEPGAAQEQRAPLDRSRVAHSKMDRDHAGSVVFSPNGRWLAIGEAKARIWLLECATGNRRPLLVPESADYITALAFSTNSQWLAAAYGAEDHDVHVWDLEPDTEFSLSGHSGGILSLAFAPDGQTLASVSGDQTLCLWNVNRKALKQRFHGHPDAVWAVAWSPDGKHVVTGGKDGSVRYWDPEGEPAASYAILNKPIWPPFGPAFLPDSESLVAVTWPDGAVVRWRTSDAQEVEPLPSLGPNHRSVALSPDGRWLALGDAKGHVRIWDYPARQLVTNLIAPAPNVFALIFSSDGTVLNAGSQQPQGGPYVPAFWTVPGWRRLDLSRLERDFRTGSDLDLSPDGRTAGIGYQTGLAAWWDLATDRQRHLFDCRYRSPAQVAFSPDAAWFATACYDGQVTLWDTARRQPRPLVRAHRNGLHDIAFSPDGQRLVASGSSPKGPIKIWEVHSGRDIAILPGEPGRFARIGFSPDGNSLFAASLEGKVLLWRAPSWKEIEAAGSKTQAP
jgi:WD40 repeat protein